MEVVATVDKETFPWRQLLPWLGLACILAALVVAVVRLHPTNLFGQTEDDSIYFSSAKGIAEGKGYLLESFPGTPAATKYPIFYPWLLSWVWRWNPSFPSNLTDAIAVSVAFGALYVGVTFLFLRRFKDLSDIETLILTAFCALHPLVVLYSGSVLAEIPFAALALSTMLLADKLTEPSTSPVAAASCGVLVGLCMLTRVFGVPLAVGIAAAAIAYRAWRPLLIFCGSLAPFFTFLLWKIIAARVAVAPVTGAAASSLGWVHTWTYYTSYLNVWREGVPTVAIFFTMLKNNALVLLGAPAAYFLPPMAEPRIVLKTAAVIGVSAAAAAGTFREARENGFRPIHFVLPFYACLIVLWNYPHAGRFLIPFLPLFAAGIWLEGKRILKVARVAIVSGAMKDKPFAIAFVAVIFLVISTVMANYSGPGRSQFTALTRRRGKLLEEKRQAYDWISRFAPSDARIVAYEDGTLYLYTGRAAIRPFTFTTAEFYDQQLLERDLDHIADVPIAIGANYWLVSDDDFGFEWPDAFSKGHARIEGLERVLPLVFRSRNDHVRLYSLDSPSCLQALKQPPCH